MPALTGSTQSPAPRPVASPSMSILSHVDTPLLWWEPHRMACQVSERQTHLHQYRCCRRGLWAWRCGGVRRISSPMLAIGALGRNAGGIRQEQLGRSKKEPAMMRWYGGMGPFGWLAMGVFWFILLALIAWLVVRLLPGSTGATR